MAKSLETLDATSILGEVYKVNDKEEKGYTVAAGELGTTSERKDKKKSNTGDIL